MLESYLKEIQRYPLLSADEEVVLAKKIESGDGEAVNYLVQCNLRLVVSVAKKFCGSYKNSIMDLIQEGNLGLMSAASKFSYTFNTRFSTYAYPWILQYILRYIYGKTSAISLPHRKAPSSPHSSAAFLRLLRSVFLHILIFRCRCRQRQIRAFRFLRNNITLQTGRLSSPDLYA